MLQGKENVVESFRLAGRPQWKLYYNVQKVSGSAPMYESDSTADLANNADRLTQVLAFLSPGRYNLQCKKDLTDNTSIIQILFEIPGMVGHQPAISGVQQTLPAIGGYTPQVFEQIMEAKIGLLNESHKREMLEKEREAEKKELEELRKKDDAIPNFLNQWGPGLVQVLMARFGGGGGAPQVGLAGFTDPAQARQFNQDQNTQGTFAQQTAEETTGNPTTEEKLTHVLQWLEKAEGSQDAGVELLHRMMLKAQTNPNLLTMLKTFLN
jgi:hypothetical protein